MTNTKHILSQIKLEGELHDLITKSNAENVSVQYNNRDMTLANALSEIFSSISSIPTTENVDRKISEAIDNLINGAPETYDTLKEISDYITTHQEAATALNEAITKKVDKQEGKGLSTEDFTTLLKEKLDNLPEITLEQVSSWNNKAEKAKATTEKDGLMSAEDKKRLDDIRGVRCGTDIPENMKDGELFVRVVSEN